MARNICKFYKQDKKCTNKDFCIEQLSSDQTICTSNLYYSMNLEKERNIYKRFLEIIEGELVHDYNPLASKIRGIIQRCKNTIEIEGEE